MVGELADARARACTKQALESLADAAMQPRPTRGSEPFVERVVDERVSERKAPRDAARLVQHRRRGRRLEQLEQVVLVLAGHGREQVELELRVDHRGRREHLPGNGAEARDALPEYLADALRKAALRQAGADAPVASRVDVDRSRLAQVAEQLAGVERVAVGLLEELVGERDRGGVESAAGGALEQLDDVAAIE